MSRAVFRPYSSSDALRSDRSASDRARHRQKVRKAIRENLADIVSEESIIGQSGERIVKVPIRGIREYKFVFGDNNPGVGTGEGGSQEGDSVGQGDGQGDQGGGGDQAGVDYYETEITLDELIDIMFEDLELPDLERRKLRFVPAERTYKRKGFQRSAGTKRSLRRSRSGNSRSSNMMSISSSSVISVSVSYTHLTLPTIYSV